MSNTFSPKGRVERLFRTLQDRLIPEMRLAGITTKSQANKFLEKYIAEEYREKFVISYEGKTSFNKLHNSDDLKEVFCIKERRVVNSFSLFSSILAHFRLR